MLGCECGQAVCDRRIDWTDCGRGAPAKLETNVSQCLYLADGRQKPLFEGAQNTDIICADIETEFEDPRHIVRR